MTDLYADGQAPRTIAIDPDDYHAEHVGWTQDGEQFFLTTPFEPAGPDGEGCEYVALYRFDAAGALIGAAIESLGPRATMDGVRREAVHARFLADLGPTEIRRIAVAPFCVIRFGTAFGLILREPEDDDPPAVEAQPGNYMAFFAPWDSGEYDT